MLLKINSLMRYSEGSEQDKSDEKTSPVPSTKRVGQEIPSERSGVKSIASRTEKGAQKPVEPEWSTDRINQDLFNFEVLKKALKAQENDLLAEISRLKNTGRPIESNALKERLNKIKFPHISDSSRSSKGSSGGNK